MKYKKYLLSEAKSFSNAQEMAKAIEDMIKQYFNKSYVDVEFTKRITTGITIYFALGKGKEEFSHGIIHNDPGYHVIHIGTGQFGDDGELPEKMTAEMGIGGSFSIKPPEGSYLAYGRLKLGWRKKTGTPQQIFKHLDNYFKKMKSTLVSNKDKFTDGNDRKMADKY